MYAKRLLAVALAALVVTSGVAAAASDGSTNGETETSASVNVTVAASSQDGAVTLTVTEDGEPVSNVSVYANGDLVGTTDADGTVTFEWNRGYLGAITGSDLHVRLTSEAFSGSVEYSFRGSELVQVRSLHVDENASASASATAGTGTGADVGASVVAGSSGGDANVNVTVSADAERESDAAVDARSSADRRGPVANIPAQAADHVTRIHAAIRSYLSGSVDVDLGATISGILGGGADASADSHAETGANAGTGGAQVDGRASGTVSADA